MIISVSSVMCTAYSGVDEFVCLVVVLAVASAIAATVVAVVSC
jgi:hypothetical protein